MVSGKRASSRIRLWGCSFLTGENRHCFFVGAFGILLTSRRNRFCIVKNKNSMMNLGPLSKMTPPQRNFFVVCIVFLFAVFFVLMWYIARESSLFNLDDRLESMTPKRSDQVKSPEERLRAIATETKTLVGTVDQVTVLKADNTRFLRIRASVIDKNRLSEVDASASSQELPMIEEVFDVVANERTSVKGDGGLDAIRSGSFVSVSTQENIFDAKRLTAVSIEKLSANTPMPSSVGQEKYNHTK